MSTLAETIFKGEYWRQSCFARPFVSTFLPTNDPLWNIGCGAPLFPMDWRSEFACCCDSPTAKASARFRAIWVWHGKPYGCGLRALIKKDSQVWTTCLALAVRSFFPPTVATQLIKIACERPDKLGRSLSQWDCLELARKLIDDGVV